MLTEQSCSHFSLYQMLLPKLANKVLVIFLIVADDKVDVSSISLSQESTILIVYAKTSAFSLITVVIYIMSTSAAFRDVFVITLYGRAILVQVGPY